MLSNLATGMFREALILRCKRYGIGLHLINPAFISAKKVLHLFFAQKEIER